MEHAEEIAREIEKRIPGTVTRIERSVNPRGPVWIDVTNGKCGAAVEWRQGMGFGVTSLPSESIGEAADETYDSAAEVIDRVEILMTGKARTSPLRSGALRELRATRRMSQEALAELLGVSQPNVSRLERRVDMNIRTLRSVIEACGGRLEIVARFGSDDAVRITQFDGPETELARRV
jgi:predicted XRE-type DNA-binding protein